MKILAFIPARGGSKGIPRKNLINLSGKPLIQYSLDIVKELDDLVVPFISTDDDEILEYCAAQGFDMSYRRPKQEARDSSACIDAVFDALLWCETHKGITYDAVLLLQPTNPLRYLFELRAAIEQFITTGLSSMVSVTPVREHPYECVEVDDSGWCHLKTPPVGIAGRQQYSNNFYFIDGTFYLATVRFLNDQHVFFKEKLTTLFYLERTWPIDIDVSDDLLVAEAFLNKKISR